MERAANLLFFGDNAEGLRQLEQDQRLIDLVYIDPPFGTGDEFLISENRANSISASGLTAYSDKAQGDEYLDALRRRLIGIRLIMADYASIYVHIDVKMEHRVRVLMDSIFGAKNFRNSIARVKCNPKNFGRNGYGNIRDTVLFYSKSPSRITWNPQLVPLSEEQIEKLYPNIDGTGRRFTTTPLHAPGVTARGPTGQEWKGMRPPPGRHWRYQPDKLDSLDADGLIHWSSAGNPRKICYADEAAGALPQDVWEYKDPQHPQYPTEKNAEMLARIINTSSNPDDTVMDCYAGSGATLLQAANLGRRFIGMDSSPAALGVMSKRLANEGIGFDLIETGDQNTTTPAAA
ncbi:MAG: site-specific DNA-methyltransferase [Albidovulum sp.]|nr:site-specific DNA-methyltransferase [Albidovulum sp.]